MCHARSESDALPPLLMSLHFLFPHSGRDSGTITACLCVGQEAEQLRLKLADNRYERELNCVCVCARLCVHLLGCVHEQSVSGHKLPGLRRSCLGHSLSVSETLSPLHA